MDLDRKNALQAQTQRRNILKTFARGVKGIFTDMKRLAIFLVAVVLVSFGVNRMCLRPQETIIDLSFITTPSYRFIGIMLLAFIIYLLGIIPGAKQMHDDLERIGFVNHANEAPTVEQVQRLNKQLRRIVFESIGMRAADWEASKSSVESALNLMIVRIDDGRNMRKVVVYGISPVRELPEKIKWHPSLASANPYCLVLGQSQADLVSMDLLKTPHWLVAATTGQGKTQLILLIVEQCLMKGMCITIADWKRGIDYCRRIQKNCNFVCDYNNLIKALSALEAIIDERTRLYHTASQYYDDLACNNTEVYRQMTGITLQHHVLIIDEASMVLDAVGRTKEEKAIIAEVIEKINSIGRIGRAYGLHLLVCTQRPDVNSVPGSVKANLDGRIAGHTADNTSSIVILDNADAAKLSAVPGRFIIRDGSGTEQIFQAYLPR